MLVDIKDYFLATPMKELEYMRVKYYYLLLDMQQRYNLDALVRKMIVCAFESKKECLG